jgi:ribosomal-protein-serine acetyltransferase
MSTRSGIRPCRSILSGVTVGGRFTCCRQRRFPRSWAGDRPAEVLGHDQVRLRRWRRDDAAALLAAVIESHEQLRPWMPWADGYDQARAAEYLRECEEQWASGSAFAYAIVVGGHIVGSAGLHDRAGERGLEIGYWVHSGWTGRGIATDAAAALTAAALALPGVDRVEIRHDAANLASGRVPAKLGYARLGERPARDLWPRARRNDLRGRRRPWLAKRNESADREHLDEMHAMSRPSFGPGRNSMFTGPGLGDER